jgi:hypothetical protein
MATLAFPRHHVPALHEVAARVLERRGDAAKPDTLAYDLLHELFEACMRTGLDGLIAELEGALSLSIDDGSALAEESRLRADLAARLGDRNAYNPRGPRAAKPRQLADCLLATLGITVMDVPGRELELADDVRRAMVAAIDGVVEPQLAGPRLRAAITALARELCEPDYLDAFDRIADELGDRLAVPAHLKLPIAAVRAIQRKLTDAREEVLASTANEAIDRAKDVIGASSQEAAARIDLPITLRLTPRDVAVRRMCDPRLLPTPEVLSRTLVDALVEYVGIGWGPPIATARAYRASDTYAIGDHIDHPKFGRGIVQAVSAQRIEVEFPDGWHTLIHARA